jgi:hypothetical protein
MNNVDKDIASTVASAHLFFSYRHLDLMTSRSRSTILIFSSEDGAFIYNLPQSLRRRKKFDNNDARCPYYIKLFFCIADKFGFVSLRWVFVGALLWYDTRILLHPQISALAKKAIICSLGVALNKKENFITFTPGTVLTVDLTSYSVKIKKVERLVSNKCSSLLVLFISYKK